MKKHCEHEWQWSFDDFNDAKILEGDTLGIPVQCISCGKEAIEWWTYSNVRDKKGNRVETE
jgi:hypothetical protein